MQKIFSTVNLYLARLERTKLNRPDILSTSIATELAERLDPITREFNHACLIAVDPEPIAAAIRATGKVKNLEVLEPTASEILPLAANAFDAIFDILDLHLVNDVPGRLIQLRRALIPDGLFMACLFAGHTLNELRQSWLEAEDLVTGGVSPRVAPMIDVREMGGLLQRADLALPVVDLDRTIVRYPDAIALIHEIRSLGLSNVMTGRSRKPVTRNLLGEAISIYQQKFSDDDGRIRATIEVAWATAWSPHESQQKPLKPGFGKVPPGRCPEGSRDEAELKQIDEMRDERLVGRWHGIVAELQRFHPLQLLPFKRSHHTLPPPAHIERHEQMKLLIGVAGKGERSQAGFLHIDGQFFLQFADQRRFRPLVRLNLAARKFPQACQGFSFRPLGNQHAAIRINKGNRGNKKDAHQLR